jgi:hypothetical protein
LVEMLERVRFSSVRNGTVLALIGNNFSTRAVTSQAYVRYIPAAF